MLCSKYSGSKPSYIRSLPSLHMGENMNDLFLPKIHSGFLKSSEPERTETISKNGPDIITKSDPGMPSLNQNVQSVNAENFEKQMQLYSKFNNEPSNNASAAKPQPVVSEKPVKQKKDLELSNENHQSEPEAYKATHDNILAPQSSDLTLEISNIFNDQNDNGAGKNHERENFKSHRDKSEILEQDLIFGDSL